MSLKSWISKQLESKEICDYQLKRERTKGGLFEKIFFGAIDNSGLLQRLLMHSTISIDYFKEEEGQFFSKSPHDFPDVQEYTSFAIAPHLSSIKDVVSCAIAFSELPGYPATFPVSKRSNFTDYTSLVGLLLKELGAFPVGRLFPLGDDEIDRNEIRTFQSLVCDPHKSVALAIEGTRQTSGMPGKADDGLEKLIKKHVERQGITHHIVPMALSFDMISKKVYVTFADAVDIGPDEVNRDNTSIVFSKIKGSMKVSYNHIAAATFLQYAARYGQDFAFNDETTAELYNLIESNISSAQERRVNLDVSPDKDHKKAFKQFISFCKKKGYIYSPEITLGNNMELCVDFQRSATTFEEYETQMLPNETPKEKISLTRQGEYTRYFSRDFPLQYMERMTRHLMN